MDGFHTIHIMTSADELANVFRLEMTSYINW